MAWTNRAVVWRAWAYVGQRSRATVPARGRARPGSTLRHRRPAGCLALGWLLWCHSCFLIFASADSDDLSWKHCLTSRLDHIIGRRMRLWEVKINTNQTNRLQNKQLRSCWRLTIYLVTVPVLWTFLSFLILLMLKSNELPYIPLWFDFSLTLLGWPTKKPCFSISLYILVNVLLCVGSGSLMKRKLSLLLNIFKKVIWTPEMSTKLSGGRYFRCIFLGICGVAKVRGVPSFNGSTWLCAV